MLMLEIADLLNGARRNQSPAISPLPDGWAVVPEGMAVPETFPFVDITTAEVDGVQTVMSMTAGVVPEPEAVIPTPTIEDDLIETTLDHEIRLAELELLGG